jgi:hypothetical protein
LGETVMRVLATSANDPALDVRRAQIITTRRELTCIMVERAADRGELSPGIDPRLAVELLVAPLNLRKLMGEPIDDNFVKQVVETLLCGLAR